MCDSLTLFVGTWNSAVIDLTPLRCASTLNLLWRSQWSLVDRSNSHSHRSRCMCVGTSRTGAWQVWVKVEEGLQEQVGQIGSQFLSESALFSWQQQQLERNLKGMIGSIQEVYFQDRIAVVMFLAQQSNSQKKRPEPQITVKQYLWQAGLDWMCSASETGPLNSLGLSL